MYLASKKGVFVADGNENTIAHLTGVKLRAHRFAFPPVDEQKVIADRLDESIGNIERAAVVAQREIDLIHEYRTRLIADVVTGKLDVREAAANLPDEADDQEPVDETEDLAENDEELEGVDFEEAVAEAEV
jgi:type I restriction enzyme, S subunit